MSERYDLVIVGAGIHGVGIAQAAAAGGQRVLVLEKQSIAAGTSSRSSKLIHGGLRYLEQFDLKLVRECLRERELLLRLAPRLVHLTPFYIPVYAHTRRRPWQVRLGLSLYALLGGLRAHARFQALPRDRWNTLNGLAGEGLQAVFQYADAQTDDAALVRAVMASATRLGAELRMPATFVQATLHADGCEVTFTCNDTEHTVRASVLVNAAGPWVDQVAAAISPAQPRPAIDLVQGTHLILDEAVSDSIFYVEAPQDGRAIFIMPWHDQTTLVGTTETVFTGDDPARVEPQPGEQQYLLDVVQHYFPQTRASIQSSFAGVRVLPAGPGGAFGQSREILFVTDRRRQPRVLGVYGGKLTSYRADAQQALRHLADALPTRRPLADTRELPLEPV
ncbi:MAG TPA: FAD-dependent oxidoreductase [Dokdonella sp.]|uniref:glycerol-3-phosphate dehydrogenase/oxidase n=1 Tax=Dokdonella sp. TaxID=2291710 RepID=UPI002D7EE406|nr:FAD-dependent oxidoreductase [Dokdonella sp.]HET9032800.1 FAD-dependent oxidoreductase [Dokdonella sp.]